MGEGEEEEKGDRRNLISLLLQLQIRLLETLRSLGCYYHSLMNLIKTNINHQWQLKCQANAVLNESAIYSP